MHNQIPLETIQEKAMVHLSVRKVLLFISATAVAASQQPPGAASAGGGFPGLGRGPGGPPMNVDFNDHTGFVQIFDGKTLNGWDGTPDL